MQTIKELAKSCRTMGELLIEQANELEKITTMSVTNLGEALTLVTRFFELGNLATAVLAPQQPAVVAEPPKPRRTAPQVKTPRVAATREVKQQIRDEYQALPEAQRTKEARATLSKKYNVPSRTVSSLVMVTQEALQKMRDRKVQLGLMKAPVTPAPVQ